jgi:hypothetical protein
VLTREWAASIAFTGEVEAGSPLKNASNVTKYVGKNRTSIGLEK